MVAFTSLCSYNIYILFDIKRFSKMTYTLKNPKPYKPTNKYVTYGVRQDTDELINKCIQLFIKQNPEFIKIPISKDKILFEMAEFYLDPEGKNDTK
jgi:hypothetical protein